MYASLMAAAAGFSVKKERDDVRSAILRVEDVRLRTIRHAMPMGFFDSAKGNGEKRKMKPARKDLERVDVTDLGDMEIEIELV